MSSRRPSRSAEESSRAAGKRRRIEGPGDESTAVGRNIAAAHAAIERRRQTTAEAEQTTTEEQTGIISPEALHDTPSLGNPQDFSTFQGSGSLHDVSGQPGPANLQGPHDPSGFDIDMTFTQEDINLLMSLGDLSGSGDPGPSGVSGYPMPPGSQSYISYMGAQYIPAADPDEENPEDVRWSPFPARAQDPAEQPAVDEASEAERSARRAALELEYSKLTITGILAKYMPVCSEMLGVARNQGWTKENGQCVSDSAAQKFRTVWNSKLEVQALVKRFLELKEPEWKVDLHTVPATDKAVMDRHFPYVLAEWAAYMQGALVQAWREGLLDAKGDLHTEHGGARFDDILGHGPPGDQAQRIILSRAHLAAREDQAKLEAHDNIEMPISYEHFNANPGSWDMEKTARLFSETGQKLIAARAERNKYRADSFGRDQASDSFLKTSDRIADYAKRRNLLDQIGLPVGDDQALEYMKLVQNCMRTAHGPSATAKTGDSSAGLEGSSTAQGGSSAAQEGPITIEDDPVVIGDARRSSATAQRE